MSEPIKIMYIKLRYSFLMWIFIIFKPTVNESHIKSVCIQWSSVLIPRRERNIVVADLVLITSYFVACIITIAFWVWWCWNIYLK
jgi:hypothetical protein